MEKWNEGGIMISTTKGRKSETDRIICLQTNGKCWNTLSVLGVALGLKAVNDDFEYWYVRNPNPEIGSKGQRPINYVMEFAQRIRELNRRPDDIEEWQLDIIKGELDIKYEIVKGAPIKDDSGNIRGTSYERQLCFTDRWNK